MESAFIRKSIPFHKHYKLHGLRTFSKLQMFHKFQEFISFYNKRINWNQMKINGKPVWTGAGFLRVPLALSLMLILSLLGGCSSKKEDSSVDLDLTRMSATMVYAEVLNIMMDPDSYIGKTIRMAGLFSAWEEEGQMFYSCIVEDATACCGQGIEFVWTGEHEWPDDYPVLDSEIEVTGVFDQYEAFNTVYYHVRDAQLEEL